MSAPEDPNTLTWALGTITTIITAIIGFMRYERNTQTRQLNNNTKRIIKLEADMVDEQKVRKLVDDGVLPIMKGIINIENMLALNTKSLAALDKKFEIDKAVREERDRILKEIEDRENG